MAPPSPPAGAVDLARGGSALIDPPRDFADAARFRDAMARLAGGVAIVACLDHGQPRGLLVSSLTSLSTEPPRMLFCVRKAAGSHSALHRADRCSLSVLSDQQGEEAARFSNPALGAQRFTSPDWRVAPGDPPLHAGAVIAMMGRIGQRTDAGSHTVFFFDVETIETSPASPLIYFERRFRSLGQAKA
jgi:flavin reductase (DIM6/NTAB) family NADH-FMN oxidoreductase RutF